MPPSLHDPVHKEWSCSVAACVRGLQLLHRRINCFLHAQCVSALAWRKFLQALQMSREERSRSGWSPKLRCKELTAFVLEAGSIRRDLLQRVHQKVHDAGDTGIRLLVEPVAV